MQNGDFADKKPVIGIFAIDLYFRIYADFRSNYEF